MLCAVGRVPNGRAIRAEAAGVTVDERGYIPVDRQMRTNVPHIFAIGDIVGQPMLAHKATHEGKVAAEVAAGQKSAFDARVIPSVAYTDPEIAWVGVTETEAQASGRKLGKGLFPWMASGRSLSLNRDEGFTKLLFDPDTHRVVGGGIVGTNAGDLISEVALAIEMGATAADVGLTDPPAPDAVRNRRLRGGSLRRHAHGPLHPEEDSRATPAAVLSRLEADVPDRALRAPGLARHADVAPVQDQPVMRVCAELLGHDLDEAVLDFAHVAPGREPGAVRDAEDVRVDGDRRLAEGGVHHDVCGLAADAGQRLERRALARHFAAVPLEDHPRRREDVLRLHAPQADRADVAGKPGLAERDNRLRRAGDRNSGPVARLTLLSVAWAERITETSSW